MFLVVSDYDISGGGAGAVADFEEVLLNKVNKTIRITALKRKNTNPYLAIFRICNSNFYLLYIYIRYFFQIKQIHLHTFSLLPVVGIISRISRKKIIYICHDYLLVCPAKSLFDYNKNQVCSCQGYSIDCFWNDCGYSRIKKIYANITRPQFIDSRLRVLSTRSWSHFTTRISNKAQVYVKRNFKLIDTTKLTRKRYKSAKQKITVIFCGRYTKDKGYDIYNTLAEKYHDYGFEFKSCGNGDIPSSSFVVDLGWLRSEEVNEQILESDIVVYPSRQIDADPLIFQSCISMGIPMLVPEHNAIAPDVSAAFGSEFVYASHEEIDFVALKEMICLGEINSDEILEFPTNILEVYK